MRDARRQPLVLCGGMCPARVLIRRGPVTCRAVAAQQRPQVHASSLT